MVKLQEHELYKRRLDSLVQNTWAALAMDLLVEHPIISKGFISALRFGGVRAAREFSFPGYMGCSPWNFKKIYQIQNFGKRWVFLEDVHTPQELESKAKADFKSSQAAFGYNPKHGTTALIMDQAAKIVAEILGPFNWADLIERCKWGKRAAEGLPALLSYLDVRTSKVSGTRFQLAFMKMACVQDKLLAESIVGCRQCESVKVTFVPKNYKAMRCIAPDTVAGGFISQGLGCLIAERLREKTHIDIRRAQHRHKELALKASRDGKYVTADLRKASDSFVWEHVRALVPKDWLPACHLCRTPQYRLDGAVEKLRSYMLMGSGHTFPMQTLFFYAILEAIRVLSGTRGRVYVYGDDCIYPSRMHRYVLHAFPDMGLTLNQDKTFSHGPFRESCGGDYHSGCDVRPFMPETPETIRGLNFYLAEVHNLLNGLLTKWAVDDIPNAAKLLYDALAEHGTVRRGLRGVHDTHSSVLFDLPWPMAIGKIRHRDGIMTLSHKVLRLTTSTKRKKERMEPYFWAYLRNFGETEIPNPWDDLSDPSSLSEFEEQDKGAARWYKWKHTETCLPCGWTEEYLLSSPQNTGRALGLFA